MNSKKVLFTLWFIGIALLTQSQVSLETARSILGDHFISSDQAINAWQKIDSNINCSDIDIPYTESTIKWFKDQTLAGKGDYYLVPTIGLADSSLGKFWKNYYGLRIFPKQTETTYRLINLKLPESNTAEGFTELAESMKVAGGMTMPAMDYLETMATLFMTVGKNACPQFSWIFISEQEIPPTELSSSMKNFKNIVLAYSAIIDGDCHEIILAYYPKENVTSGLINNRTMSLGVTNGKSMDLIMIPLKDVSCLMREKNYSIGIVYFIKP